MAKIIIFKPKTPPVPKDPPPPPAATIKGELHQLNADLITLDRNLKAAFKEWEEWLLSQRPSDQKKTQ